MIENDLNLGVIKSVKYDRTGERHSYTCMTLMMTSTEVVETSFSQKSSPGLQSPGVIEISKFFNFREIHKTSVIDTEKPAMF